MPLVVVIFDITGCAYRFTNTALIPPDGIKTIAVEAVYDTSREVLPHQYLWDALQKSIAQNGKLKLVSQNDADALLRAHITKAHVRPTGTAVPTSDTTNARAKDPEIPVTGEPGNAANYKNITKAGRHTSNESLSYTIIVEVWNLHTQKLIKSATYNGAAEFKSFRDTRTDPKAGYLVYDEALQNKFRDIAQKIADKAVFDVLF